LLEMVCKGWQGRIKEPGRIARTSRRSRREQGFTGPHGRAEHPCRRLRP
jgi:hypothetical protein